VLPGFHPLRENKGVFPGITAQKGGFPTRKPGNGLEFPTRPTYYLRIFEVLRDVSLAGDFWWILQRPHRPSPLPFYYDNREKSLGLDRQEKFLEAEALQAILTIRANSDLRFSRDPDVAAVGASESGQHDPHRFPHYRAITKGFCAFSHTAISRKSPNESLRNLILAPVGASGTMAAVGVLVDSTQNLLFWDIFKTELRRLVY
jgi:hypothetical protein